MSVRRFLPLVIVALIWALASPLAAQQSCQAPPINTRSAGEDIFTAQQENDLGDAVAEHIQRSFRVIDDDEVTGYLRRVGERLLRHIPPTDLRFQFYLFDVPVANAFSLPGGRIYVSRKLVAFARSEDELAGVLAHEIGHELVHESAADVTRMFREVLGVSEVSDRRDIYDKYNRLLDNAARKPGSFNRKREEHGQLVADNLGVYSLVGAGYSPQAFVDFWDRFAQTKGKTGNAFTDFFGATKPESRRLREMIHAVAALPGACIEAHVTAPPEEFQKWQAAVVNYTGLGRKEALHAVLTRKTLDPPLQSDITHLKFSPDGKFLLAQNDASLYVLTRRPFENLFRIDAPNAHPAQFSPDSKRISFYDSGLRVEWWDVEGERREAAHEVVLQKGCLQTALSPDGKLLACYGSEWELTLVDVTTGTPAFQKKNFYRPRTIGEYVLLFLARIFDEEPQLLQIRFSPDGRYFAAASHDETAIAVELSSFTPVKLDGEVKKLMSHHFAFLGSDRIVGVDQFKPEHSGIVRFPTGEVLAQFPLGNQSLEGATHGEFVMLRPIKDYPLGLMDLSTKKIVLANKKGALDVYDDTNVSERTNGELGLYPHSVGPPREKVTLPRGPLGPVRAVALSQDLNWLAISGRDRGAVWNLAKNERVFHVRAFRGAYFGGDGAMYADFPKQEGTPRMVARLDLARREVEEGSKIEEGRAEQHGPFLVLTRPNKKSGKLSENATLEVRDSQNSATLLWSRASLGELSENVTLEVRDSQNSATLLWSRGYPKEAPRVFIDPLAGTMVLAWEMGSSSAKNEIENDSGLSQRLSGRKTEKTDRFLEVLEARSGKILGGLVVETGKRSFGISDAFAVGDWVIVQDNENRTMLYSLATGEQKGKFFGRRAALSKSGKLMCLENERGMLAVYDLSTLQKRDEFIFSSPVSFLQLDPDGKRLFVLTSSQNVYLLDLTAPAAPAAAASKN